MEAQPAGSPVRKGYDWLCARIEEAPAPYKAEILHRARGRQDAAAHGAMFEIYVFAVLRAAWGPDGVRPLPERDHPNHPDFLLSRNGEVIAMVEATLLNCRRDSRGTLSEPSGASRCGRHVRVTGWLLVFTRRYRIGSTDPSRARLAEQVDIALGGFDRVRYLDATPTDTRTIRIMDNASSFELWAIPCSDETEPCSTESRPPVSYWNDYLTRVRDAVKGKIKQHCNRDHPLVVAIGCNDWPGTPEERDMSARFTNSVPDRVLTLGQVRICEREARRSAPARCACHGVSNEHIIYGTSTALWSPEWPFAITTKPRRHFVMAQSANPQPVRP